jgi:hypothetical protein
VVSKSWTNEPGFLVKTTGRFEVEDFAIHIPLKPCSPSGAINRPKSSLTWRHSVQSPKYLLGSEIGVLMQSGLGVNDEESS